MTHELSVQLHAQVGVVPVVDGVSAGRALGARAYCRASAAERRRAGA